MFDDDLSRLSYEIRTSLMSIYCFSDKLCREAGTAGDNDREACNRSLKSACCNLADKVDEILRERDKMHLLAKTADAGDASRPAEQDAPDRNLSSARNFAIELKEGVRPSSFRKYASTINAYATSTASLQKICRANHVPSGSCHKFMKSYYPEAAERHKDILEGRFAVTYREENLSEGA